VSTEDFRWLPPGVDTTAVTVTEGERVRPDTWTPGVREQIQEDARRLIQEVVRRREEALREVVILATEDGSILRPEVDAPVPTGPTWVAQGFTPTGHLVVAVPSDLPQTDRERLRYQGFRVRADPANDSPTYSQRPWSDPESNPLQDVLDHVRRLEAAGPPRRPGESTIDAAQRVLARPLSYDAAVYDSNPDRCWRCDAKGAETDVGLCTPCHEDLRG
jgi:hypothetical protein